MAALEPLTMSECWERLRSRRLGRIGFDRGRGKRIHPMCYTVGSGGIYLTTSRDSELGVFSQLFAPGAFVSFEIDHLDREAPEQWSVLVLGRIETQDHAAATPLPRDDRPAPPDRHDELLLKLVPFEVTGRRLQDARSS